jgi:hypothetical protein
VRRIELRPGLHTELLQDWHQRLAEAAESLVRFPHVDDAEAVLAFSGDVRQQAVDRPVTGDSNRLRPSVSLRTTASYWSRVTRWKTATVGTATCSKSRTAGGYDDLWFDKPLPPVGGARFAVGTLRAGPRSQAVATAG